MSLEGSVFRILPSPIFFFTVILLDTECDLSGEIFGRTISFLIACFGAELSEIVAFGTLFFWESSGVEFFLGTALDTFNLRLFFKGGDVTGELFFIFETLSLLSPDGIGVCLSYSTISDSL